MSWKDVGRDVNRKMAATTAQKQFLPNRSSIGGFGVSQASPFMRYLLGSSSLNEIAPNPRDVLDLYDLIMWAIPELAACVDMHTRVIGFPEVESKDEIFKKDYYQWVDEFTWKGELNHTFDQVKGLRSYIQGFTNQILATGQGFSTMLDSQGNPIQRTSQPISSVKLHESRRFYFRENTIDNFQLDYEHGGIIDLDVKKSPYFMAVNFINSPKWAWGMPALYGTERVATAALLAEEGFKAHFGRVSDPNEITIMSFEPSSALAQDSIETYQKIQQEWATKTDATKAAYASQIGRSAAYGKSFQALEAVSGGKLDIANHIFGSGIQPIGTYEESVLKILARAIVGAYCPPDLLGIQTQSGGGIGSDQHSRMAQRMESFGISCRPHLEAHIDQLMVADFLRKTKRIPEFEYDWHGFDLSNEKGEAEVEKLEAEARMLNIEAAQLIVEGAGIAAANEYLKQNDIGFLYPETASPPPIPKI